MLPRPECVDGVLPDFPAARWVGSTQARLPAGAPRKTGLCAQHSRRRVVLGGPGAGAGLGARASCYLRKRSPFRSVRVAEKGGQEERHLPGSCRKSGGVPYPAAP